MSRWSNLVHARRQLEAARAGAIEHYDKRIADIDAELATLRGLEGCERVGAEMVMAERRARWSRAHGTNPPSLVFVTCGDASCIADAHLTVTPRIPESAPASASPGPVPTPRRPPPIPAEERRAAALTQHEETRREALVDDSKPVKGTKLSVRDVRVIRAIDRPFTKADEKRFGVSRQQLLNIRNRTSWQWVPE